MKQFSSYSTREVKKQLQNENSYRYSSSPKLIGRRNVKKDAENQLLDWSDTDMRGVNLNGANLAGANLYKVNFAGAILKTANLSGTILCASKKPNI
ncbi:MAG: pentapeptide repeat-containing protein [Hassallia sp.]